MCGIVIVGSVRDLETKVVEQSHASVSKRLRLESLCIRFIVCRCVSLCVCASVYLCARQCVRARAAVCACVSIGLR